MNKITLFALLSCYLSFGQLTDPDPNDNWEMSQIGANNLLSNPYDIVSGPDGYLWITERTLGKISRFHPETGVRDQLVQITSVYSAGQQDGLMGLVLHPDLGKGLGTDYVYAAYTYNNSGRKLRISRFTYTKIGDDGTLANELTLIEGIPASYDHNSGRLAYGPDAKLYYTIGDQGNNQFDNKCNPIGSQVLPTSTSDYTKYPGKILRLNLDGTIPIDNPTLSGIKSHVYSYGHRNAQGLVFGSNGKLYASEHGPKSDDELNIVESGKNYGWPNVVGFIDDKAYSYCNWSSASNCSSLSFSDNTCPSGATSTAESSWTVPTNYKNPVATWGTVPSSYDFTAGCGYICWPSIAPSGIDIYEGTQIPNWGTSILVTTLKRGRIYRCSIASDGNSVLPIADPEPDGTNDDFEELWYTQNRYRDIVAAPDGKTFYIITDSSGSTSGPSNNNSIAIQNPGIIIKVKYIGTTLGTNSFATESSINIVPNPAKNKFKLQTQDSSLELDLVEVIDSNKKVILTKRNPKQEQDFIVESLSAGLYWVRITDKNGNTMVKKLIVTH